MVSEAVPVKMWGSQEFWGVGSAYDPDWVLNDSQKALQREIIELCRTTLRPNAIKSDTEYTYPRANMDALAEHRLLGLIVPKEFGGRGESHVCAAMVCETIARYGCSSTAVVYVMHTGAVAGLCFRYLHNPKLKDVLTRIDKDKLIGTLCYSDPATGGHFWFPLSSKAQFEDDGEQLKVLKYASWTTSAGFADWYVVQTMSPGFDGDYSNMTCYLMFKDEVRADTSNWSALGMHGNQSGPLVAEATITRDRLVGPIGDGRISNDEIVDPWFNTLTAAAWNGLALAALDLGKKHVTGKVHADVGLRVCDYPSIQDYFGEFMSDTMAMRSLIFNVCSAFDKVTNNCDWSIHKDLAVIPRAGLLHMSWVAKFSAAKNVTIVVDKMLHACGGTGYKTELGLERVLRDAKAAWVMGPSNEVCRQFIGKTVLMGMDAVDYWAQRVNFRQVHEEVKKMSVGEKRDLAQRLLREVELSESQSAAGPQLKEGQDKDFDNPLATRGPTSPTSPSAAVAPNSWAEAQLLSKTKLTASGLELLRFKFKNKSSTSLGTLPGQYVRLGVPDPEAPEKIVSRYFSPVSRPDQSDTVDICIKYETCGHFSNIVGGMNVGDSVKLSGPCGGFEYRSNSLDTLVMLVSGAGATPAVQIVRSIVGNKQDKTKVAMIYYAENSEEFLFKLELDSYHTQHAGQIQIQYSIGEYEDGWSGHVGFINRDMIRAHLPKVNGNRLRVILCGGPSMVITCVELLYLEGYPSEILYIYGAFAAEQVRRVYGRNAKLATHTSS